MVFKKIIAILSNNFFPRFANSSVNIFCVVYFDEIEQSNAGCNEIELNIVAY